ncbi:MAG: site-specific integrase, partial [Victivallales bacterium]|nr:site-specific integrase [Victivallales bacterium]
MADKTAAKGRAKGTGQIFKKGNRFYLQIRSKGERKTFLLRNADDSYCTTKAQAEEAAKRINKKTLELDTLENVVDTMAGIRQLKREATFGFDDIWPSFLKSANRPDANENHLREQKRELDRFVAWVCEQERKPNVDTEQSKKKGRSKPLADEAQTQKITSPAEITPELANEYMGIIGKNVSNRTFNVYLGYLRLIFSLTYAMAGLRSNPFEGINRRTEITASRSDFTEQQIAQIFAGFSKGFFEEVKQEGFDGHGGRCVRIIQHEFKPLFKDEMEVLLKLCCFTGCDGQSGCLMKWDGVNMDMNTISYIREKTIKATGGKVITLPIHPVLRDALEKAQSWREADCPYILPHVAERYKRNHWGVQKDVQKIIHCALKVDVTNRESVGKRAMPANRYSLHSFRHSFVS